MSELFESFGTAMAIGIFCIYAVLVLLFHDFLQPATILMALPLSLGGALAPLVATGTAFSMPAVIGLLMLMGVVTKNSILLVEYAIMARRNGMARLEALVDACHKRARPIVMTTIAMGAGMLPVALGLSGGDASFRAPMAIVVIGGVVASTFLSLLVIPVIFTFVDDLGRLLTRPFRREPNPLPDAGTAPAQ
jgi:multidrug efflux pump subunit AcrB